MDAGPGNCVRKPSDRALGTYKKRTRVRGGGRVLLEPGDPPRSTLGIIPDNGSGATSVSSLGRERRVFRFDVRRGVQQCRAGAIRELQSRLASPEHPQQAHPPPA